MNLGEVNKGAVILIVVLLLGAGGYLWWSQMYKPAVAARTAAQGQETAAQGELAAAKSKLAAAQKAIDDAKAENGKPDDSVARVQLARKAIPSKRLIDDAAIVLTDLADRSGIRTSFDSGGDEASAAVAPTGSSLNGATPIDLEFKAAGTYQEMMLFMRLVEDTVVEEDGKLYARDRLFNVVALKIGEDEESDGGSGGFAADGLGQEDANEISARPGEVLFTVTVRMYTSSTENAASVGATADPAAQPTEGAGAPTDGSAAGGTGIGSDPNSTGATAAGGAADPAAGGTGATDPAAGGATTTTDTGAAAPAAGGVPS